MNNIMGETSYMICKLSSKVKLSANNETVDQTSKGIVVRAKKGPCIKVFNLVTFLRNLKSLLVSKNCTFTNFVSRLKT